MIDCHFTSLEKADCINKSVVLSYGDLEIMRARFVCKDRAISVKRFSVLPSISYTCVEAVGFVDFVKHTYAKLRIHSFKGPSAAVLTIKHIKASVFTEHGAGLVIFGKRDHCYMLRFVVEDTLIRLEHMYEVNHTVRVELEQRLRPSFSKWNICSVCFVPTTTCCSNCETRYCSKTCQELDWPKHRAYCRFRTTSCEEVCSECESSGISLK